MKDYNNQRAKSITGNTARSMNSVEFLKSNISMISKVLSKYDDTTEISELSINDAEKTADIFECSAMTLRKFREYPVELVRNEENNVNSVAYKGYNAELEFDGKTMRLFLPNLFNHSKNKQIYICDYIRLLFNEYKSKNGAGCFWHTIMPPYIFVVRRYVRTKNTMLTDNDNFASCNELNAVINTIAAEFLVSDDWKNMDWFSINTKSVAKCHNNEFGTEIIMFEKTKENLLQHIDDLL